MFIVPEIENALIVFVYSPDAGLVKRRLAEEIGAEQAAKVYDTLTRKQLDCFTSMPQIKPYVFFAPAEKSDEVEQWLSPYEERVALAAQAEGDPGERMHSAFRRIFSRNEIHKAVIAATDCPDLTPDLLRHGFAELDNYDVVLGPAEDGGYYLLGMREFYPRLFEEIEWQDGQTAAQTIERAKEQRLSHTLLPVLRDVDTGQDLDALCPEWRSQILK